MMRTSLWIAPVLLIAALLPSGCGRYGAQAGAAQDTLQVPLPETIGSGTARLFLYRINSLRTGERVGVGREFRVEPDRQVRAVLQLQGVDPAREILLHVMWVNPDGQEVYTKETRITERDWRDPARREELGRAFVHLDPQTNLLEFESRYGVDPIRFEEEAHKAEEDRSFTLGTWLVRFYLFRKLYLETSFELLPQA
jgi:hypothetical protein